MNSLSICIPSNRNSKNLDKCLKSIYQAKKPKYNFDVCISDNSLDDTKINIIKKYNKKLKIKYHFIEKKTNRVENMSHVVQISNNDFIWLIGDDEIITKNSLINLEKIFMTKKDIDLIFVNTMMVRKNQKINSSTKLTKFYDLIDYRISNDFMGGMFLSVFKREKWFRHKKILNKYKYDKIEFATLGSTFPHLMVFSKAFMNSNIFFSEKIYSGNFIKNREWSDLWHLVQSIRLPELLDMYRRDGLPLKNFLLSKNYALRFCIPHILKIMFNISLYPITYFQIFKFLIKNSLYPYLYFSPLIWLGHKLKN